MRAADVLEQAGMLVSGDRAETHGDARQSFIRVSEMWSAYLGQEVKPVDVAHMMVLFKMTRAEFGQRNEDDWRDMAGYAALASEVSE